MAITDKKISESYSGRDISSLSDRPNEDGLSGAQLKARLDQLGKEIIPNFNDLIDELNDTVLPAKADQSATYTKTQSDALLVAKVDKVAGKSLVLDSAITDLTDGSDSVLHKHDTMYYTESETDVLLTGKADAVHTHVEADITDLDKYTQSQTDTLLLGKVDVVSGKELSTNDYTDDEQSKLAGIEASANNYSHPATHSADIITDGTTNHAFTALDDTKLGGIEAGAEVNNISDVNATDLTDGGDSTLHYHSADRYTLPTSQAAVLGGVKVGSRLSIADGVLSADVQTTDISGKVDKVAGSSLVADTTMTDLTDNGDTSLHYHSADRSVDNHTDGSTNKLFTATLKTKLDGIAAGAVKITISADAPADPVTNDLWLDI